MAAACAEYLSADHLIYLTDVAGVLDGSRILRAVNCEEIGALVESRVVSGGMLLKLEAAKRALEGGVAEVRIVGGAAPDALFAAMGGAGSRPKRKRVRFQGTRVTFRPHCTKELEAVVTA